MAENNTTLLILGAAGVGAFLWWKNQSQPSTPAPNAQAVRTKPDISTAAVTRETYPVEFSAPPLPPGVSGLSGLGAMTRIYPDESITSWNYSATNCGCDGSEQVQVDASGVHEGQETGFPSEWLPGVFLGSILVGAVAGGVIDGKK